MSGAPTKDLIVKANFGCGSKVLDGWANFDKYPVNESVAFCDLDLGIPLSDDTCDQVLLDNVIEHCSDIPFVLKEIERVLRVGGTAKIITPHFSSAASFRDPTHKFHLSYFSFDYVNKTAATHYMGIKKLTLISKRLSIGGGIIQMIGLLVFRISPQTWENYWCFIFRGSTLTFEFEKV